MEASAGDGRRFRDRTDAGARLAEVLAGAGLDDPLVLVSPRSALGQFGDIEVVALRRPHPFGAVGAWYDSFEQVDDEEVLALLRRYGRTGVTSESESSG